MVRRVVAAIRREDPDRLVIADGLQWGRDPVFELADLGIAQSTRGYDPMQISHYRRTWVGGEKWPEPTWPLKQGDKTIDREWLYEDRIEPWKKLADKGVGVHVGEWGAFNKTPHDVVARPGWATTSNSGKKPAGAGPCGTSAAASASSTAAATTWPTKISTGTSSIRENVNCCEVSFRSGKSGAMLHEKREPF